MDASALVSRIHAMPIGADLILKEKPNHAEIIKDGKLLADVLIEAAQRYETPLAAPVMDLTLEKHAICTLLGIPPEEESTFHFTSPLPEGQVEDLIARFNPMDFTHMKANIDAVAHIASTSTSTGLTSVGMSIGPFSLMTKLISEPITPVYMMAMGMTADDDEGVKLLQQTMELSTGIVLKYLGAQLDAGAKFIFIAEPAANVVYISPKQMDAGSDIFERVAMDNLRKVKSLIDSKDAFLFFHCCGQLTGSMVKAFASLKPAVMSLGSPQNLPDMVQYVDKETVLFGNLPSKKFYSDAEITVDEVVERSNELLAQMEATRHPFILGSECDVLSVPGCQDTIMSKVMAMLKTAKEYTAVPNSK